MSCKWNQKLDSASKASKSSKCETCDVASYLVRNMETLSFASYAYSIPRAQLSTRPSQNNQSYSTNRSSSSTRTSTAPPLTPTSDLPPSYEEAVIL